MGGVMTTLREAAQQALDALDSDNPDIQLRAAMQEDAFLRFAALVAAEKDKEIERLREEVRVLRLYGNKDYTSMADEALKQEQPPVHGLHLWQGF